MLPDDFGFVVALEPLGSGIPAYDDALGVEHIDGIVGDRIDQHAVAASAGFRGLKPFVVSHAIPRSFQPMPNLTGINACWRRKFRLNGRELKSPLRPCKARLPTPDPFLQPAPSMPIAAAKPSQIRSMLLMRQEIALLDLRHEAAFATGHPLFAANMAVERIALEAEARLPRKDTPIVLYDAGEGLVEKAAERFAALGYSDLRELA